MDERNEECAANPSSDFEYRIMRGKVTITRLKNEKMQGEVVIPQIINGLPVTTIGNAAFKDCVNLTKMTIPPRVTEIGGYAFEGCCHLTIVSFSGSAIRFGRDVLRRRPNVYSFSMKCGCRPLQNLCRPEDVSVLKCTKSAARSITIDAPRGSDIWKYFRKQRFEKWRKYLRSLLMFLVVSAIF